MAYSEARIKATKYHPEKLPDSWYGAVPNLGEVAPPIVDLKRFSPFIITLTDIQLMPTGDPLFPVVAGSVELRARYDDNRVQTNTGALLTLAGALPLPGAWRFPAKDILNYTLFGLAPGIANFPTHYGLWVIKPTVAHKLLYGIKLTAEEQELNRKLGISDTVEKGLLPLPISQQIEREYYVLGEETHTAAVTIGIANTLYTIENLYPRPNEFLVLTRIATVQGLAAGNVRMLISRDGDNQLADVATFPLSIVEGGEVGCFIPAIREISLQTIAGIAPVAPFVPFPFRYTFLRVKWTNILRVRFGQVSKDEVPADLWEKVAAGVL